MHSADFGPQLFKGIPRNKLLKVPEGYFQIWEGTAVAGKNM